MAEDTIGVTQSLSRDNHRHDNQMDMDNSQCGMIDNMIRAINKDRRVRDNNRMVMIDRIHRSRHGNTIPDTSSKDKVRADIRADSNNRKPRCNSQIPGISRTAMQMATSSHRPELSVSTTRGTNSNPRIHGKRTVLTNRDTTMLDNMILAVSRMPRSDRRQAEAN